MNDNGCALASDTKVETPEGGMAIRTIAGKNISVFTREDGRVRFRMMLDVRKLAEQQPVLKIALENGGTFRVAPHQILYKKGMVECRADGLKAGDQLEPVFHYPEQYEFRDDAHAATKKSGASIRVIKIEDGGTADLYTLAVNRTGCFFLTAGVLCKAAGTSAAAATSE